MHVITVLGTRPEGIKLAPVIQELVHHAELKPIVISTGQHRADDDLKSPEIIVGHTRQMV